jgi:hypothetical protein
MACVDAATAKVKKREGREAATPHPSLGKNRKYEARLSPARELKTIDCMS